MDKAAKVKCAVAITVAGILLIIGQRAVNNPSQLAKEGGGMGEGGPSIERTPSGPIAPLAVSSANPLGNRVKASATSANKSFGEMSSLPNSNAVASTRRLSGEEGPGGSDGSTGARRWSPSQGQTLGEGPGSSDGTPAIVRRSQLSRNSTGLRDVAPEGPGGSDGSTGARRWSPSQGQTVGEGPGSSDGTPAIVQRSEHRSTGIKHNATDVSRGQ